VGSARHNAGVGHYYRLKVGQYSWKQGGVLQCLDARPHRADTKIDPIVQCDEELDKTLPHQFERVHMEDLKPAGLKTAEKARKDALAAIQQAPLAKTPTAKPKVVEEINPGNEEESGTSASVEITTTFKLAAKYGLKIFEDGNQYSITDTEGAVLVDELEDRKACTQFINQHITAVKKTKTKSKEK
jgi:hypothetical protein